MKTGKMYSGKTYRKEVSLTGGVVEVLEKLAEKERRTVKNYMESVLINHVHNHAQTNGKLKGK